MVKNAKPAKKYSVPLALSWIIILFGIIRFFTLSADFQNKSGLAGFGVLTIMYWIFVNSIIAIIAVWIIFGIISLVKPSASTKQKQQINKSLKNIRKRITLDKFSVVFSIIMTLVGIGIIILYVVSNSMRVARLGTVVSGLEMFAIVGYCFFISPIESLAIVLSIISIVRNKKKYKTFEKMPKQVKNLTIVNIISTVILSLALITPLIYIIKGVI